MKTFELHRETDINGVSGTGIVAQGVIFSDGTVVASWLTATATTTHYASIDDVKSIHGHDGATKVIYTGNAFTRGIHDCMQDRCENAWFGSVGGWDGRMSMQAPWYITPAEREAYLAGYKHAAPRFYGADVECAPEQATGREGGE